MCFTPPPSFSFSFPSNVGGNHFSFSNTWSTPWMPLPRPSPNPTIPFSYSRDLYSNSLPLRTSNFAIPQIALDPRDFYSTNNFKLHDLPPYKGTPVPWKNTCIPTSKTSYKAFTDRFNSIMSSSPLFSCSPERPRFLVIERVWIDFLSQPYFAKCIVVQRSVSTNSFVSSGDEKEGWIVDLPKFRSMWATKKRHQIAPPLNYEIRTYSTYAPALSLEPRRNLVKPVDKTKKSEEDSLRTSQRLYCNIMIGGGTGFGVSAIGALFLGLSSIWIVASIAVSTLLGMLAGKIATNLTDSSITVR